MITFKPLPAPHAQAEILYARIPNNHRLIDAILSPTIGIQ
jgi:hypothetical protein